MEFLALDLAKTVGYARRAADGSTTFGSHDLGVRVSEDTGRYFYKAEQFISTIVSGDDVSVVYEKPFGDRKSHQSTLLSLFGFAAVVERYCFAWSIPCRPALIADVRAHYLAGKIPRGRDACKAAVIAEGVARGYDVGDDDDAADALAILDYALFCFKQPGIGERPTIER